MDSLIRWLEADPTRTQFSLAKRLKVSPPTVHEWVHGESSPSTGRIHGLHEATDIPVEVLIADCETDRRRRKRAKTAA
jgi:transcriptional regulator with XRE-family HTH domain